MKVNRERPAPGLAVVATMALLCLAGCGGGASSGGANNGGGGSGPNVVAISVNSGPTGRYLNGVFASVTVCVPNTSTCQIIPNLLVDTGSSGLRILRSQVQLALPTETATLGGALVECTQFVGGFVWGPVNVADVKLAGETASNVPIQIIDDNPAPAFAVPTSCSGTGTNLSSLNELLANGVLGVGNFRQDCGAGCINPGHHFYFACSSSSSCTETPTTLAQQAQNPVWMFASDNNGVVIQLPTIPDQGLPSVAGSLIFGIGTQSNNMLGSATVLTLDAVGNFTTTYNGNSYPGSFMDSGSNAIFFLTTALTGLPSCGTTNPGFYCPTSTQIEAAINRGSNGNTSSVSFKVANLNQLSGANFAFDDVAGSNPTCKSNNNSPCFDFGLPLFYGRTVFTAIEGQTAPGGTTPYIAY